MGNIRAVFHAVNNDWQQMGSPEGSKMSSEVTSYADCVGERQPFILSLRIVAVFMLYL